MALTFTGTNGIFTRIGLYGAWINSILNSQGNGTLTTPSESVGNIYTELLAQFTDSTKQADWFSTFVPNYLNTFRAKPTILATIKAAMQDLLIRTVSDDTRLAANTLPYAWNEMLRQLIKTGGPGYFTGGTITATAPAAFATNVGTAAGSSSVTGPILPGTIGDQAGVTGAGAMVLQYVYPETIVLTCTQGAAQGATLYSEPFSLLGDMNVNSDRLTWDWSNVYGAVLKNGSGANGTVNVTDAARYNGSGAGGNILNNGDFLTITANTPNNWTIVTGVAGTGFLAGGAGTGIIAGASNSVKCTFDATPTLLAFKQAFANAGVAGGSTVSLLPNTVYALGYWVKADAGNVGSLNMNLVDNTTSLGVVVNDNNAVANTVAVDISTVGTAYEFHSGFFRTPAIIPASGMSLRIDFSGALVNTKKVSLSNVAIRAVSPIYTGGPYIALFSGLTGSVLGDGYNCVFANNFGGLTNKFGFVQMLDMLFDIRVNGLANVPIVGTTLINDSLVA